MAKLRLNPRPSVFFTLPAAIVIVAALSAVEAAELRADRTISGSAESAARAGESTLNEILGERIAAAALARTAVAVTYDPAYQSLSYPNGDVAADRGVCTDLVIRSLRAVGVDLQRRVHEDMRAAFDAYPKLWGASGPDRNIDHRRVPNLETYLTRTGARLPASDDPRDYQPGDIIAWNLRGRAGVLPHIGVVTDEKGPSGWPKVVHNIGRGPQHEDVLLLWPITGRYRLTSVK
ncbi:MAG: DUF1287 domain-containing protein [Pseudomonadota bacterium]